MRRWENNVEIEHKGVGRVTAHLLRTR